MKIIRNRNFPEERALYGADGVHLIDCTFDGEEDGESALKEATNLELTDCYMNLRYPLWHDDNVTLTKVTMTPLCRAALWYTKRVKITDGKLLGIKAVRECDDVELTRCEIDSPEFGWKSENVRVFDSQITSEYLFLLAKNVTLKKVAFRGKYSFQYVENLTIEDSELDTKDAFWHTKNVTVKNSVLKGEYLAWYSDGLTLVNCKIIGTQPFCYCTNLTLVDCEMEEADFSFEYSDVNATVKGEILSVKNPRSGKIVAKKIGELIYTDDSKVECKCEVHCASR